MTLHSDYAAYILGLAPEAHWDFAGSGAAALTDRTGNGHDLTAAGSPTVDQAVPNFDGFRYATLDGSSQYFTPGSPSALKSAQFSLLAVMYPQGGDGYLWSSENNVSVSDKGWSAIVGDAGHNFGLGMRLDDVTGHTDLIEPGAFGIHGAGFILIGCTYDGVNGTFWVNGSPSISGLDLAFNPAGSNPLIGKAPFGAKYFTGFVSDVSYFTRPLSSLEMLTPPQLAGLASPAAATQLLPPIAALAADLADIRAAVYRSY